MTHYQKLATMIFRIVGLVTILGGLLSTALALTFSLPSTSSLIIFVAYFPYIFGGLILFVLSKFLAKIVCFDLGKLDDEK